MAISVGGLASGLDTESIISQLMEIEQRPITLLQQDEAFYQAKISAFGTLKATLSSFQSAVSALTDSGSFVSFSATSSNSSVVGVSASDEASPGNYQVTVTSLAQAQQVRSASFAGNDQVVGTGTLTLQVGAGAVVDIEIDSGHQTLAGIASSINEADVDVTAGVVHDGSGNYYLTLSSQETGSENTITLTIDDADLNNDDASGLSSLYSDPVSHAVTETQEAGNAQLTVNGIAIERSSNIIDDLIDGVTLTVNQEDPGNPFTIKVAKNSSSATSKVQAFVDQYNTLAGVLGQFQEYNTETGESGTLQGDATTRQIQSRMRSLLYTQVDGVAKEVNGLSRLGVEVDRKGKLSLDASMLTSALEENQDDVVKFFSQEEFGNNGLAKRFDNLLDNYLNSSTGLIANKENGFRASIDNIADQIERVTLRIEKREEVLRSQFATLELLLSNFQTTSGALSQQLENLTNLTNAIYGKK
ncbi:MAG: flagellar filament capping protein FliD [Desulfobulbaceae bacterium]|uniref:Flagellar hook-associated protein 2 n=1 Tax=Candidatus Desulfobia pelagia TaxID=2841692 RepID=A0A8J6NAN9_9BACT|nr:flagellar filament capping protein FliD [Candidatus Desulfobia pelagia]